VKNTALVLGLIIFFSLAASAQMVRPASISTCKILEKSSFSSAFERCDVANGRVIVYLDSQTKEDVANYDKSVSNEKNKIKSRILAKSKATDWKDVESEFEAFKGGEFPCHIDEDKKTPCKFETSVSVKDGTVSFPRNEGKFYIGENSATIYVLSAEATELENSAGSVTTSLTSDGDHNVTIGNGTITSVIAQIKGEYIFTSQDGGFDCEDEANITRAAERVDMDTGLVWWNDSGFYNVSGYDEGDADSTCEASLWSGLLWGDNISLSYLGKGGYGFINKTLGAYAGGSQYHFMESNGSHFVRTTALPSASGEGYAGYLDVWWNRTHPQYIVTYTRSGKDVNIRNLSGHPISAGQNEAWTITGDLHPDADKAIIGMAGSVEDVLGCLYDINSSGHLGEQLSCVDRHGDISYGFNWENDTTFSGWTYYGYSWGKYHITSESPNHVNLSTHDYSYNETFYPAAGETNTTIDLAEYFENARALGLLEGTGATLNALTHISFDQGAVDVNSTFVYNPGNGSILTKVVQNNDSESSFVQSVNGTENSIRVENKSTVVLGRLDISCVTFPLENCSDVSVDMNGTVVLSTVAAMENETTTIFFTDEAQYCADANCSYLGIDLTINGGEVEFSHVNVKTFTTVDALYDALTVWNQTVEFIIDQTEAKCYYLGGTTSNAQTPIEIDYVYLNDTGSGWCYNGYEFTSLEETEDGWACPTSYNVSVGSSWGDGIRVCSPATVTKLGYGYGANFSQTGHFDDGVEILYNWSTWAESPGNRTQMSGQRIVGNATFDDTNVTVDFTFYYYNASVEKEELGVTAQCNGHHANNTAWDTIGTSAGDFYYCRDDLDGDTIYDIIIFNVTTSSDVDMGAYGSGFSATNITVTLIDPLANETDERENRFHYTIENLTFPVQASFNLNGTFIDATNITSNGTYYFDYTIYVNGTYEWNITLNTSDAAYTPAAAHLNTTAYHNTIYWQMVDYFGRDMAGVGITIINHSDSTDNTTYSTNASGHITIDAMLIDYDGRIQWGNTNYDSNLSDITAASIAHMNKYYGFEATLTNTLGQALEDVYCSVWTEDESGNRVMTYKTDDPENQTGKPHTNDNGVYGWQIFIDPAIYPYNENFNLVVSCHDKEVNKSFTVTYEWKQPPQYYGESIKLNQAWYVGAALGILFFTFILGSLGGFVLRSWRGR